LRRRPAKAGLERVLDGVERDLGVKHRRQNSPIDLGKRTTVEGFPYLWIQRGHTLQTHDNPLLLIAAPRIGGARTHSRLAARPSLGHNGGVGSARKHTGMPIAGDHLEAVTEDRLDEIRLDDLERRALAEYPAVR